MPVDEARQGRAFGQGIQIVRIEGLRDSGEEKVLVFRSDGTSETAMIVLTGDRPDANRDTLWQIAVDSCGAVHCQERLPDEAGE